MRILWLALGALWSCSSPGVIVGALAHPSFVSEEAQIYAKTNEGLVRVQLNGEGRAKVFPAKYGLLDVSQDGATFALEDADTNLYLGDPVSGKLRKIEALRQRVSDAKFSPDGKTLAAVRHADFSLPQEQWSATDEDTLYLIDVESGAVEVIPASSGAWPVLIAWSVAGDFIWLKLSSGESQRVERKSQGRAAAVWPDEGLLPSLLRPSVTCGELRLSAAGWRGDEGLFLERSGEEPTPLVLVKKRRRGLHDYQPTTTPQMFSASCDYALFSFSEALWIVELKTRKVAPLVAGADPFPVP